MTLALTGSTSAAKWLTKLSSGIQAKLSHAFVRGEGGDEDQAGDVVGVSGSVRDNRTSVRVADG
jgi:hypothetical protein